MTNQVSFWTLVNLNFACSNYYFCRLKLIIKKFVVTLFGGLQILLHEQHCNSCSRSANSALDWGVLQPTVEHGDEEDDDLDALEDNVDNSCAGARRF